MKKKTTVITKTVLSSELGKLENRIDTKFKNVDSKFQQFQEYVNERFQENIEQTKNIVLNSQDKVLGELQKMRDDDAAHRFSHIRTNEEIEELQRKVGVA